MHHPFADEVRLNAPTVASKSNGSGFFLGALSRLLKLLRYLIVLSHGSRPSIGTSILCFRSEGVKSQTVMNAGHMSCC